MSINRKQIDDAAEQAFERYVGPLLKDKGEPVDHPGNLYRMIFYSGFFDGFLWAVRTNVLPETEDTNHE